MHALLPLIQRGNCLIKVVAASCGVYHPVRNQNFNMTNLVKTNENVLKEVKRKILAHNKSNINAIILFGSRARGDFNEHSDYDIKVFVKKDKKIARNYSFQKEVYTAFSDNLNFNYLKRLGHPFLYCAFRDGIALYQKKQWFDKNKLNIIKIKPSKKITSLYLNGSINKLEMIKRLFIKKEKFSLLNSEDSKIAANQLGFGILMSNNLYPISPHSLQIELEGLNKKYKKVAVKIKYLQDFYYLDRKPSLRKYKNAINSLIIFAKKYAKTLDQERR